MARSGNRLTATLVRSTSLVPGLYHDGNGLYLQIKNGGRSWVLRYMLDGTARYMGLGSQAKIPLAKAREAAKESYALIASGIDPIEQRRQRKQAARIERPKTLMTCSAL